jgi:hypothetical protein
MHSSDPCALFVAHPGHELLLYGWLQQARPSVFVLTDGSGHAASSRLPRTRRLLRSLRAPVGSIFGRVTDQEAYAAILRGDLGWLIGLAEELAAALVQERIRLVVADAAEGYNPVHDLCRFIVGTACSLANRRGSPARHCEFSVVGPPDSRPGIDADGMVLLLDDAAFAAKIAAARALLPLRDDVEALLGRFGESAFRRECFRAVDDWTAPTHPPGGRPHYELIGEERVARNRYERVIRYADHVRPLQAGLTAWLDGAACAS